VQYYNKPGLAEIIQSQSIAKLHALSIQNHPLITVSKYLAVACLSETGLIIVLWLDREESFSRHWQGSVCRAETEYRKGIRVFNGG
jgi:hypothetical protein